jgi:uncharacterized membrane protein
MTDAPPPVEILPYATPQQAAARLSWIAVGSITLACMTVIFTALMGFTEGLTVPEARRQVHFGHLGGIAGGALAILFALASYRQRGRSRGMSHVALTLSLLATFFATLPDGP